MTLAEFRRAALRPDRWSGLVNGVLLVLFGAATYLPGHDAWGIWLESAFLSTLIVVNALLIANAARRARRTEARQAETWKPWADRLTRLLPKRLSTRGYLIYQHAAGDVQAVKSGFRWWPLLLRFVGISPIAWAIHVRLWWLAVLTWATWSVALVAAVLFPDALDAALLFLGFSVAVTIAYIVTFFDAADREGRRFEKIGYTLVDHIHGRSGPHAIALFAARK